MPLHSDGGAGSVMLHDDRRADDIGGGSGCNTMPPKPLEGDFLLVPPLLCRTPAHARGRIVWWVILAVAGCVIIDEPDFGCSCS